MRWNLLTALLPLALLIAIPFLLRPVAQNYEALNDPCDKLVIITPHTESLRREFSRAFEDYYNEKYKRNVKIEWRSVGGTSDIVRFIADRFEVLRKNGFFGSDASIGIDLFFGGGQFDHNRQAEKGYAVDAGIQKLHPEWFKSDIIPQRFSGETFYDKAGRYYGTCLSTFGICWNFQRISEMSDKSPPRKWASLGEPRFFGKIAIADPTKSGSVNKCFEMIVQQEMAEAYSRNPKDGLVQGWANGLNLIKRIAANSRYVTDSASKVPHDTATGNAAAGICIDFYGRSEAEWSAFQNAGKPRMAFVSPEGGTSLSADPVQLLRGAPNKDVAVAFIEFVLSLDGQKLWDFKLGTPGGPKKYVLRRMPIRKDLYIDKFRSYMTDPDENPYISCASFEYHPEWTLRYFNLLRVLIKCIALDSLPELQDAWQAIIDAGGPEAVPEAVKKFNELPFSYAEAEAARQSLILNKKTNPMRDVIRKQMIWSEFCRGRYREAAKLAREGR
ncbi:MAG: hypothetical protein A2020_11640 [Lentisphaerae bacterium GWF2_45_14]|nr:MAG: hypothetical protein A2020_11640 [Lentisphaerae bacterium GWF2_45_14]